MEEKQSDGNNKVSKDLFVKNCNLLALSSLLANPLDTQTARLVSRCPWFWAQTSWVHA